jgi:hypothetical protein
VVRKTPLELPIRIAPGIKVVPTANRDFKIGVGVSIPMSDDKEFDVQTILSVFYHF